MDKKNILVEVKKVWCVTLYTFNWLTYEFCTSPYMTILGDTKYGFSNILFPGMSSMIYTFVVTENDKYLNAL